jgi:hypothetical protein
LNASSNKFNPTCRDIVLELCKLIPKLLELEFGENTLLGTRVFIEILLKTTNQLIFEILVRYLLDAILNNLEAYLCGVL